VNELCKSKADCSVCKKSMFVGMDIHKNFLQVAILDEKGNVLNNSRVDNNLTRVNEFFDSPSPGNNAKVVMESSGMWYNIYECLRKRHLDILLSNPTKTRAIASAKIKTDKLDAVRLADLPRGGYIAECYVPNKRIMELRDIVRHRAALVRMRTKLKNKVHGITLMKGIEASDVDRIGTFTRRNMDRLEGHNDYRINGCLRVIKSLIDEINTVSKRILLLARMSSRTYSH
jgi:transposase